MTTALELRREGWKPYVEAARRRPPPPGLALLEQHAREQLLGRIRAAAEVLKTRFGVRHVVLFGSLAHGAWFTPDADVAFDRPSFTMVYSSQLSVFFQKAPAYDRPHHQILPARSS